MFEGKPRTAFLLCEALPSGRMASRIFSAYKCAFILATWRLLFGSPS